MYVVAAAILPPRTMHGDYLLNEPHSTKDGIRSFMPHISSGIPKLCSSFDLTYLGIATSYG